MTTTNISTTPGLGDQETINSATFAARPQEFHPYDGSQCADPQHISQWAELKSSFLSQSIITKNDIEQPLLQFVKNIISQIYNNNFNTSNANTKFQQDFSNFVYSLGTSRPGWALDAYPVSQARSYNGRIQESYDDVYIMFNFIKFKLFNFNDSQVPQQTISIGLWDPTICELGSITQYLIYHLLMQPIFNFLGMVRGNRKDTVMGTWNEVGITYITHPYLRRQLKNFPTNPITPWVHPGNAQCKMPYRGKWGEKIRLARAQNNVWASYMCGISGSSNFMLFSFLLAVAPLTIANPRENMRDVFTLSVAMLTGDGGHNIREVFYGITLSIILLHAIFYEIRRELRRQYPKPNGDENDLSIKDNLLQYDNDPNFVRGPILQALLTKINILFNTELPCQDANLYQALNNNIPERNIHILKDFLHVCGNLEPFVDEVFEFTEDINIVGISAADLNAYDPNILTNPGNAYNQYKDAAIKNLLNIPNTTNNLFTGIDNTSIKYNEEVQIFLALESNRYLNDNWETAANNKMEELISDYNGGDEILTDINKLLNTKLRDCNQDEFVDRIPFAFPSSKKSKQKKYKDHNK